MELPVMGRIAAGVPIEAISEVSHHIAVPGSMLSGKRPALRAGGQGRFHDRGRDQRWRHRGDPRTVTAENGDIVVALVEDSEATLKRFAAAAT
jgi:repressor LexA